MLVVAWLIGVILLGLIIGEINYLHAKRQKKKRQKKIEYIFSEDLFEAEYPKNEKDPDFIDRFYTDPSELR